MAVADGGHGLFADALEEVTRFDARRGRHGSIVADGLLEAISLGDGRGEMARVRDDDGGGTRRARYDGRMAEIDFRGAKIVATLGPASMDEATLAELVEAGMDVARLNFSHADHAELAEMVRRVRAVQQASGKPLAIVGDLQGPKIRVGKLADPIVLAPGFPLRISVEPGHAGPAMVSADYPGLANDVSVGDRIFLKDGAIELEVTEVAEGTIGTVVRTGGTVTSRAGMNVPGVTLRLPTLTEKDKADIRFAIEQGMDYLALSFVRRAEDMVEARALLGTEGAEIGLIAKIETALALEHLDAIVQASDGVMVARGDLGVEIGPEQVPIWQRKIARVAAMRLVPVIIATQMLESMVENPRPTRAEASDVANAVWDGADAVMLSAETAIGSYPVETVAMMDRIIRRAEESEDARHTPAFDADWLGDPSRSVSWAVRSIVEQNEEIRGVVAFTMSGYTARLVSEDRMGVPVLVLAPERRVEQRTALLWGVTPVRCTPPEDMDTMLRAVDSVSREYLGCKDGDVVIVVGGIPLDAGKPTNFLKLHSVGDF